MDEAPPAACGPLPTTMVERLLEELDYASGASGGDRRRAPRATCRVRSLIVEVLEGAERFAATTRNISRDGISFLLAQHVPPGVRCKLRLVNEYGQALETTGRVIRCRTVDQRSNAHEIGVEFNNPIDVALFSSNGERLRVLLVDDDPQQAQLLNAFLRRAATEFHIVADPDLALDIAGTHGLELFLVNLDSPGIDATRLVKRLRDQGYTGEINLLTTLPREEDDHLRLGAAIASLDRAWLSAIARSQDA